MKKRPEPKPSLHAKIDEVQSEINVKIDAIKTELSATRTELNNRIGFLSSEVGQLDNRVSHIEKNMATKDDVGRLALAIQGNQTDLRLLQNDIATKKDIQIIIDTIDAFTNKVTVQERKALTHDLRINELEPKVEDHERRIVALETR